MGYIQINKPLRFWKGFLQPFTLILSRIESWQIHPAKNSPGVFASGGCYLANLVVDGRNRSGARASNGFGEQGKQVFFGHVQDAAVFGTGDGVHEGCFFLLQFQNSLLNGILGDELVHLHMGLLADAVGPVCGLILGRLVPLGVKVDDDVRRCQVQPGAAGL